MIYSVHQPHYIPYPGYLAKVASSDHFVFLEDVQFVKREWQNRNRVKGPDGPVWLTVPVKGEYKSLISEMHLDESVDWRHKHLETLRRFYSKAPAIEELPGFEDVLRREYVSLADLCMATTGFFLDFFGIQSPRQTMKSMSQLPDDPNERIIAIGKQLSADVYLAGSGGKNYMDLDRFENAGIEVRFFDAHHLEYPQLHGEFVPNLGAIDLMLMTGADGFDQYVRPLI